MDIEQHAELVEYLRGSGRIAADREPRSRILAGGVSNRTVLVEGVAEGGEAWVLKQALERLRVADEWLSSPERIHREAAGMRALGELMPAGAVPRLLFEDHRHHVLAMTAVPAPHENWRDLLLAGELDDGLVAEFGSLLGLIHRRSRERVAEFSVAFADASFFESLRLEPYYASTAQRVPAAARFLTDLIAETRVSRSALVHGDYSPKNVLVREGRLVLLDHEVIHWGDPAFDVGFAATHLLSKANHLPAMRARFIAAAARFAAGYADAAGARDARVEARSARHALGCLLARVDGRSPLGYLSQAARARQRAAVLALIAAPPPSIAVLAERFAERIAAPIGESFHADH